MGTAVPGLKLANDEDRQLRMRQHARGLATEEHPAEPAAAMRGHDDGVAAAFARRLQDALPRLQIRHDVEKISLLEQEWGWNPPKRVFEQILEAASKQKQPISQPPVAAVPDVKIA